MPRNKTPLLIAGLLLAGCQFGKKSVFVDVDRALLAEEIPGAYVTPAPTIPPPVGSTSLTLPGLPAETVKLHSNAQRVQEIQRVIERNRRQAQGAIARGLRNAYYRDIKQTENTRIAALIPEQRESFEKAIGSLSPAFQAYATKRGQLITDLSLIAGFPDADPRSQRPPSGNNPLAKKDFERAKELRAELSALDKEYEGKLSAVFATLQTQNSAALEAVRVEMQQLREAADARARAEAAKQINAEQEQIRSVLEGQSVVSFPAEPQKTVTIAGSSPPAKSPEVNVPGKEEMRKRLRAAIESDVKIWAALKDYRVASSGADATAEFIRWRKTHLNLR